MMLYYETSLIKTSEKWRPFAIFCGPFLLSIIFIFVLLRGLPELPDEYREHIKFPSNLHELKQLGIVLSSYKGNYYWQILLLIISSYIFLQSFMIPGSVLFSILLGYLFPFPVALLVIALCSAVGASCCYFFAGYVGSRTLLRLFPDHIMHFRASYDPAALIHLLT
ncbi:unnamed protein product [Protopolystoma xenopodis]|uniref:Uncharacterized protein n=1 Tax=Protopolystoma xenopodis TaxID=117903 RepID=A0A3S5AJM0_9PLAT|nr:unnamed protein product [Protopolystoma xenopodis]